MPESPLPNALKEFRAQVLRDPTNPLSFYLQAIDCRERGDLVGWKQAIATALSLPHLTPQQRYCRSFAKIALGDWSGWREYDERLSLPETPSQQSDLVRWIQWTHKAWDGVEDLRDQTLLVLPEQGIGDVIQMLRFIPSLIERAREVIVMVYPRLVPLVQCNFGHCVTIAIEGADVPIHCDRYALTMSLPGLVGHLPRFMALRAPRERQPLRPRGRPRRGGICWAGNPEYPDDALRSMPVDAVAPLIARQEIEWYSLQVGGRAIEADAYPQLTRPWPRLITFADTADLMMELDFVVSVDTATAHLAASLGRPTLLMLPYRSDPRWGLDDDTTAWYPTMRFFRQPAPGDWAAVVDDVQRALTSSAYGEVSITAGASV